MSKLFLFHNHSETILISQFSAKDTFFIIMLKTVVLLCIVVETVIHFFFHDSLIKFKRTAFFFLHIINAFAATFDQSNVSIQNKRVLPLPHNIIHDLY